MKHKIVQELRSQRLPLKLLVCRLCLKFKIQLFSFYPAVLAVVARFKLAFIKRLKNVAIKSIEDSHKSAQSSCYVGKPRLKF